MLQDCIAVQNAAGPARSSPCAPSSRQSTDAIGEACPINVQLCAARSPHFTDAEEGSGPGAEIPAPASVADRSLDHTAVVGRNEIRANSAALPPVRMLPI